MNQTPQVLLFALAITLVCAQPARAQEPFWRHVDQPHGGLVYGIVATDDGWLYAVGGGLVYHSTDRGESWQAGGAPTDTARIHPLSLVAGPGGMVLIVSSIGLHRSTDHGEHWARVTIEGIGFHGADSISSVARDAATGHLFAMALPGILRSTDNGATWSILTQTSRRGTLVAGAHRLYLLTGINLQYVDPEQGNSLIDLTTPVQSIPFNGLTIVGENDLYISSTSSGGDEYYRSTDRGATWKRIDIAFSTTTYDNIIANSAGELFHIGQAVHRSTDRGESWQRMGTPGGLLINYTCTIGQDGAFYWGTYDGIARSIDSGRSWTSHKQGIAALSVRWLVQGRHDLVAESDSTLYASSDEGETWQMVETPTALIGGLSAASDGTLFLHSYSQFTQEVLFFKSSDDGRTWSDTLAGFPRQPISRVAARNGDTIYLLHNDATVSASTDGGMNWTNGVVAPQTAFNALVVDTKGDVFVGYFTNLYRSTDVGRSWQQLPFSNDFIYTLAADDRGNLCAPGLRTISLSSDGGETWKVIADSSDGVTGAIAMHFGPEGERYVLTERVVWSEDDNGRWRKLTSGLNYHHPLSLAVTPSGRLVLGTNYGGIYVGEEKVAGVKTPHRIESSSSITILPNPVSSSITLHLDLPMRSDVRISMIDMLGRAVATIHTGELDGGEQRVEWDASGLTEGAYLVQVIIDGEREQRMVVKNQ